MCFSENSLSQSQSSSPTLVVLLQWIALIFGGYPNVLQGRRVRIKHRGLLKTKLRFFVFFKKPPNPVNLVYHEPNLVFFKTASTSVFP